MQRKDEKKEPKNMLRLLSLLLALLMWVNFSGRVDVAQTAKKRTFSQIPLVYLNKPPNLDLENQLFMMHVTVSGSEKNLNRLESDVISANLDLAGIQEGTTTLPLSSDIISLPPSFKDLEVVSVIPDKIKLNLVAVSQRKLKLVLNLTGQPHPDYEHVDDNCTPAEVTLRGPTKRVEGMSLLLSKPVDITGAQSDLRGTFEIADVLPRDAFLLEDRSNLGYHIKIEEKTNRIEPDRVYPLMVNVADGEAEQWDGWVPVVTTARLTYSGPVSLTRWFQPEWVAPKISVSAAEAIFETTNLSPRNVGPPEGIANGPNNQNRLEAGTPKPKIFFSIENQWQLPVEERANTPDWLDRVAKLNFIWSPDLVEVIEQ